MSEYNYHVVIYTCDTLGYQYTQDVSPHNSLPQMCLYDSLPCFLVTQLFHVLTLMCNLISVNACVSAPS